MSKAIENARRIAAEFLTASGRRADAHVVIQSGGDDFAEVQLALLTLGQFGERTAILERALQCYADPTFWNGDQPEASLAFHDQGEIAQAALAGKESYGQHRD